MKSYAAYYNHEVRKQSSSGAFFSLIALYYDVIYGVAMTEDCYSAEFRRIEGDVSSLRGSKYFQARVGDTFRQVKQDLEDGKTVLFTGTGCQVNGLRMFLQKDYSNLLTIDVICHGTPSPKLWDIYARYREEQYDGKMKSVNFRCKYDRSNYDIKENQFYISKDKDPFMQMFLRDYCLRPACYQCHAKELKLSDLTIGDFWGIEKIIPEMDDSNGTSLVITRTEKGQSIFETVKRQLKWKEISYEEGVLYNSAEYRSSVRPKQRETFFHDLSSIPFSEMEKKYVNPIIIPRVVLIKRKIKQEINRIFKRCKIKRAASDYGLLFTFLK